MADTKSMCGLDIWDLAAGEVKSQGPQVREFFDSRVPLCPPPSSLETQEFNMQYATCNAACSMDSLEVFDLAPGEDRSQSPRRYFHQSEFPPCPPATLDTQEFENSDVASEDVWIVEDSLTCWDLAPGQPQTQDAMLDLHNSRKESYLPPSLDTQEFADHHVTLERIWLVEDSLTCWDSALGEARSQEPVNYPKPDTSPLLAANTPARSGAIVPVSSLLPDETNLPLKGSSRALWSSEKLKSEKKSVTGPNVLHKCINSPSRLFSFESSSASNEGHGEAASSRQMMKQSEDTGLATGQRFGLISSSQKHLHLATVHPVLPSGQMATTNDEMIHCPNFLTKRRACMDVTNSTLSQPMSLKEMPNKRAVETSVNDSTAVLRNSLTEGTSYRNRENDRGLCLGQTAVASEMITDYRHRPAHIRDLSSSHGVDCNGGNEEDGRNLAQVDDTLVQEQLKFRTLLVANPVITRKRGQPDCRQILEGWQCPKAGKKYMSAAKQLSLDHWLS